MWCQRRLLVLDKKFRNMKKFFAFLAGTFLVSAGLFAICGVGMQNQSDMKPDSEGHMLGTMWNEYRKAEDKDKPQTMASVLSEIIAKSMEKRYSYDFWDASQKYVSAISRRNWKAREEEMAKFKKRVGDYDEPIVTFSYRQAYENDGTSAIFDWASGEEKRLSAAKTEPFYSGLGNLMSGALPEYVENDWQYVLWKLADFDQNDLAAEALVKTLDGKYPAADYAEYLCALRLSDQAACKARLEELAARGKAVSFYPRASLLVDKMSGLSRSETSSSEDYKALLEECRHFEKERGALSGKEAAIAKGITSVHDIIEDLEAKDIAVLVSGDTVKVLLRNLSSVKLSLYKSEGLETSSTDRKAVLTRELKNTKNHFYVKDTVETLLGPLDDGAYYLEAVNGKVKCGRSFSRHTLSMAVRWNSDGCGVYLADWKSGRPLDKATLTLSKNGKEVAKAEDFELREGFTPLPASMTSLLSGANSKNKYYELTALFRDGVLRSSEALQLSSMDSRISSSAPVQGHHALVMTDRGAFNPGDTVNFKVVLYTGDGVTMARAAESGLAVSAVFNDSEGNQLETKKLKTNEFGSIASSFVIPEGKRNGSFSIRVRAGGDSYDCAYKAIRVDEFVLPTFEVSFEEIGGIILPGDIVTVRGNVKSYSGHTLSEARISYKAELYGAVLTEGSLSPASDGSFAIPIVTNKTKTLGWYKVQVDVTDNTGETHTYSTAFYAGASYFLDIALENAAEGELSLDGDERRALPFYAYYPETPAYIVSEPSVKLVFNVKRQDGSPVDLPVKYSLKAPSGKVLSGTAISGKAVAIDLSMVPKGILTLNATSIVEDRSGMAVDTLKSSCKILRLSEDAVCLDTEVENVFLPIDKLSMVSPSGRPSVSALLGSTKGETWAVAELYGQDRKLLAKKNFHLDGKVGGRGSLARIDFPYEAGYPAAVRLVVFYFKDGEKYESDHVYRRPAKSLDLPLAFTSFQDKALPDHEYKLILKTLPGIEALAAVFDKSTETIYPNNWNTVRLRQPDLDWSDYVNIETVCGNAAGSGLLNVFSESLALTKAENSEVVVTGFGAKRSRKAASRIAADSAVYAAEDAGGFETPSNELSVRDVFRSTLAFEPFLRSSSSGEIEVPLKTSGKLSTYKVQIFAHDKTMHNAVVDSEMVVSVPVKTSIVEPKYLYYGDKYSAAVSVSSSADAPVSGTMVLYQYDSSDYKNSKPKASSSFKVRIPAGGSASHLFDVQVPESKEAASSDCIGLMAVFYPGDDQASADYSDAIFVKIPLLSDRQTLTEAHSGILMPGLSADSLRKAISSRFTGTSAYGAVTSEISIIDMVREAIPSKAEPSGPDLLSLTEAWYIRKVASSLGVDLDSEASAEEDSDGADAHISNASLEAKITACQNADGGFSWFEGLRSSPVMTAVVLERFSKAGSLPDGLDQEKLAKAVKYLDDNQFAITRPYWCGGLSDQQYMLVRSLYPSVSFDVKAPVGRAKEFSRRLSDFRKVARGYLVPSGSRGSEGYILGKARRLTTLLNLLDSDAGISLAKDWGIRFASASRVRASAFDEVTSLLEYSVDHPDGGIYYPNAVLPFRGLLESEAYAHSLLCDLLTRYSSSDDADPSSASRASEVADGIRIWLMLQKETQQWEAEPGFMDAVASIMAGSDEIKSVKVIVMTKTYEKPFDEIKAAGNDLTLTREFYREKTLTKKLSDGKTEDVVELVPIEEGTCLAVGDRISIKYKVWSKENRSFVRLTAPREASLRPVDQLSGYSFSMSCLRPLILDGWYTLNPGCYRNVRTDRTEYYFDSYPEEKSEIVEEFFVTQAGSFKAPAAEIESLYAPHYRANAAFTGPLRSAPLR